MPLNDKKPWYKSVTILSSLFVVGVSVLRAVGEPALASALEAESVNIVNLIVSGVTLVGTGVAIYGRVRANTEIG